MRLIKFTRPCLLAALAMVPATAWAQTAPANTADAEDASSNSGVTDIIVTAQKREESLQDVPVAVTAFSGDTLADRGITDAQALSRLVPNMGFSDAYSQTRITLRGLSFQDLAAQGGEARVAYHVDGAYMAMTGDIGGTFYDIERVEVNRGPQGTLFGRNATAGTVNVITRDPTDTLSGYINAEIGNYRTANVEGAIGGPLADGVSARIAFQTRNHSGYDYNVPNDIDINNQRTQAIRGKLKVETGSLTAVLSADYFNENDRVGQMLTGYAVPGTPTVYASFGALLQDPGPNPNPRHNYSGQIPLADKESYGATLDLNIGLTDSLTLASLTNYRNSHFIYRDDHLSYVPGTPGTGSLIESRQFEKAEQLSEELRLTKDFDRGNIVLGGFLYSQDYSTGRDGPVGNAVLSQLGRYLGALFGFPPGAYEDDPNIYVQGFLQGGAVKTRGEAIFGQATYEITDTTKLIVGARYSWERRTLVNAVGGLDLLTHVDDPTFVFPTGIGAKVSYRNFSPRVTLEQKIGPDAMVYATYARGFKAGGFNVAQPPSSYQPETLTNYEAGFKADLFDRKLRLNGAGFYYDYKDLQTLTIVVDQGGAGSVNVNATAEVYGAELELNAVPVDGLELDAAAALIHGEFTLGNLDGERLPYMPSFTLSYGAQYTFPTSVGDITIRGDGQTKGRTYFDNVNNPLNSQDTYSILNASIGWKDADDRFSATLFVKNITNKLASNGGFALPGFLDGLIRGSWDPPRTWGARFGVKF